mgnify:CR=1 FL=1
MATLNTNTHTPSILRGLQSRLAGFAHAFGDVMTKMAESRSRTAQIESLKAKSDAELRAMGIYSEVDLYRHVFRDMMV